jgi:hypothetical protein
MQKFHIKLGLFQSNFVLVIGITLLIPFNSFSDTSLYIVSNPSWYYYMNDIQISKFTFVSCLSMKSTIDLPVADPIFVF